MKVQKAFLPILSLTLLSACGKSPEVKIKGLDLGLETVEERTLVTFDTVLTVGNLRFPAISAPIRNPNNGDVLGEAEIGSLEDGTNKIFIKLDYEKVFGLEDELGKSLPNGKNLPLPIDATSLSMVGVPFLENSRVYLGGRTDGALSAGIALSAPAFESAFKDKPAMNLFLVSSLTENLTTLGGLYTSPSAGKTGIGVFGLRTANEVMGFSGKMASSATPNSTYYSDDVSQVSRQTWIRLDRLIKKRSKLRFK